MREVEAGEDGIVRGGVGGGGELGDGHFAGGDAYGAGVAVEAVEAGWGLERGEAVCAGRRGREDVRIEDCNGGGLLHEELWCGRHVVAVYGGDGACRGAIDGRAVAFNGNREGAESGVV